MMSMLDVNYVLLNNRLSLAATELLRARKQLPLAPEQIYVLQDQVIPANSPEISAAQHKLAAFAKQYGTVYAYGSGMASHYLTQEVVQPGDVVVANDRDILMVGAQGALGLAVDAEAMAGVLATGKLALENLASFADLANYKQKLSVEIRGSLADGLDMRDAGMALVKLLAAKVNAQTLITFIDRTAGLNLEDKMLLCGWCQRLGVLSAVFVEQGEKAVIFDLAAVQQELLCPSNLEAAGQEIVAVYLGGSHGGFLADIKLAAELLQGKQIARRVRLSVAPASSEVYYRAATAGYCTTIMEAGGLMLNQCAAPPVQARIGKGEILVSNDIHNEQDYAGQGGYIVLADTRTAVQMALTGILSKDCGSEGNVQLEQASMRKSKEGYQATLQTQAYNNAVAAPTEEPPQALPMSFSGRVWKFSDDIDTDIIMPTQHLSYATMEEIQTHMFEPLRPELAALVKPGDIIVAGNNFGCGSSREQAAEILAFAGIKAIIAKSFARIFFRNAINNGVLLIECPELPDHVAEGDKVTVRINQCIVHKGKEYPVPYLADNLYRLIMDGGLVKSTQKQNGLV